MNIRGQMMRKLILFIVFWTIGVAFAESGDIPNVEQYNLEWVLDDNVSVAKRNGIMVLLLKNDDFGQFAVESDLARDLCYFSERIVSMIDSGRISGSSSEKQSLKYGIKYIPIFDSSKGVHIELRGKLFARFDDQSEYVYLLQENAMRSLAKISDISEYFDYWDEMTESLAETFSVKRSAKSCDSCHVNPDDTDSFCRNCGKLLVDSIIELELPLPVYKDR